MRIYSKNVCMLSQIYMKCLFEWSVICEGHYILPWLMWDILRVACSMKVNVSHVLWALSEVQALQWWFDRIIQLYSQTILAQTLNIWHPSLSGHEDKWEKWEREIDFIDRLLQFTWIHLVTDNLSLGIFEELNFCYNHKPKKAIPPPQTYVRHL